MSTLIHGIGVNDSNYPIIRSKRVNGKKKILWKCPYYQRWSSMMTRCYSEVFHKRKPSYKDCYVCDEWLSFMSFKSWMETQEWEGKDLDKDLLFEDNKVYSPDTCMFMPHEVNAFIPVGNIDRKGVNPIGVTFNKRDKIYYSQVKTRGKQTPIGSFRDPILAHQAWQKKKLELAIELQSRQDDDRVRKGLQRVIDKLDFHIKNGIETVSL